MSETCIPRHDWFNDLLTFGLCCGLIISYLPQHFRIINAKSSEGFSPVFLLLGTTSSAATMFNMITLQAEIVKCCRVVSFGSCAEIVAGIVQVGIQWFCFSVIFVLYMIYYPLHLRYVDENVVDEPELQPLLHTKTRVKSTEWGLSIIVAWISVIHLLTCFITTVYLLSTSTLSPEGSLPPRISSWATFLGVSSALLAAVQYAPQILHTYRMKLVGALSIPMMLIQTPGGILMVTSIALRKGTNWTSWITFAVAAVLQGCLLVMCCFWKIRQDRLGIDDFGNPLDPLIYPTIDTDEVQYDQETVITPPAYESATEGDTSPIRSQGRRR
ncbi:hypothetical protein BYT27DRAFT_7200624 [Phlegmacium glaucopus]|nr:hypothetical protein BYT27DRAFT_7200624 [Phlegmacium glaucopus]